MNKLLPFLLTLALVAGIFFYARHEVEQARAEGAALQAARDSALAELAVAKAQRDSAAAAGLEAARLAAQAQRAASAVPKLQAALDAATNAADSIPFLVQERDSLQFAYDSEKRAFAKLSEANTQNAARADTAESRLASLLAAPVVKKGKHCGLGFGSGLSWSGSIRPALTAGYVCLL